MLFAVRAESFFMGGEKLPVTHKEALKKKKASIQEIKEKMEEAKIAIITDYRGESSGLSVQEITDLRQRLRRTNSEYKIYKNTLCKIAMAEIGAKELIEYFKEPTAILFGFEDPAASSKELVKFIKEHKTKSLPIIKAAYLDGEVYDESQVKVLATLPSRDELLSMLLRTMNSPIQGFVNVLSGIPRSLVTVLDQIRKQKEEQS